MKWIPGLLGLTLVGLALKVSAEEDAVIKAPPVRPDESTMMSAPAPAVERTTVIRTTPAIPAEKTIVIERPARTAEEVTVKTTSGGPSAAMLSDAHDAHVRYYGSSTKGPFYYQSGHELMARKLARGVGNVTLCVAEIPNQMFLEAYRTSPVSGGVVGIWKGIKKGAKRLAIGTWEIFTFYYPGRNYYQPYIEPEVVFQEYLH